jgi:hypothetical protein
LISDECAIEIAAENGIAILQNTLTKNSDKERIVTLIQKLLPSLPTNVPLRERKKEDNTDTTTTTTSANTTTNLPQPPIIHQPRTEPSQQNQTQTQTQTQ